MKRFIKVLLVVIGICSVFYVLSHRHSAAGERWEEELSKVPGPDESAFDE